MSNVVFEEITKRFDDVIAVDQLTLEVQDGEFLVLLGPSGCGKTTALRMVAGLDTISSGTLRIGDRVVNDIEAKDRDVSMVFQSYALYPHMTVAKNIESPLIARKVSVANESEPRKLTKAERDLQVADAAQTLGLTDLLNRKPAALSGGQRQRVALARAIVSRPKAFLMDEPLSNLDAKLRAQTRVELVDLQRRLNATFLYVTHDQVEAMTMATRIAIMNDGRLQQVGPPQAVYERPQNLFVARFIGSPPMNTIAGTIAIDNDAVSVTVGSGRIPVSQLAAGEPTQLKLLDGASVIVGVRPEHLSIESSGTVAATIKAVEWLGHERHVICDVAGTSLIVRQPSEGLPPAIGSPVQLAALGDEIHLFDPGSTERIN
ncbi:MAG: ABC transporter ATP-binding protein [Actinomycetes bacterium]